MEKEFRVGDLIWGKTKTHPWWPGQIYHEALASTSAQKAKKRGRLFVAFFGDNCYIWLQPRDLLPFESSYKRFSNQINSESFIKVVNEAVLEVKRRAVLGLTCRCRIHSTFQQTTVEGLLEVGEDGDTAGNVYRVHQIEEFRQEFQPVETLSFIQKLALDSINVAKDNDDSKEAARVLAFRKAKSAKVDEPYFQAFGVDPKRPRDSVIASNLQKIALVQAPTGHPPESESKWQSKPRIECQNKHESCRNDKQHPTRIEAIRKESQTHDSNRKVSQEKTVKSEVERNQKFTKPSSAGDNNRRGSPSLSKKPSTLEASSVEPHVQKESKDPATLVSAKICDAVHVVRKGISSATPTPSETHRTDKNPPASSKSSKRFRSSSPAEVQKRPATSRPQNQILENVREKEKNRMSLPSAKPPRHPRRESRVLLSMKFPKDTALPSASELKAKFVRFGPIDTSATRVCWKNSSCQVVFMRKTDAEAAYEYAIKSKNIFGQAKVSYRLLDNKGSNSNFLKCGRSGAIVVNDSEQLTPVHAPPHATLVTTSTPVSRIKHLADEVNAKHHKQTVKLVQRSAMVM